MATVQNLRLKVFSFIHIIGSTSIALLFSISFLLAAIVFIPLAYICFGLMLLVGKFLKSTNYLISYFINLTYQKSNLLFKRVTMYLQQTFSVFGRKRLIE